MADGGIDDVSESVIDINCEFCCEYGKQLEAEGLCKECDEYLCDTCIGHHKGNRLSRHHEILDKENMPRFKTVYSKITATFLHDINVKSTVGRHQCWIPGSAVLSDSKLLVADEFGSKVKLIDTQTSLIISELQVSGEPKDIAVIDSGEHVAVTVPKQNIILLLKVTDSIVQEREISVKGQCHGIVYSKNQLIVSYLGPEKIEFMDLQGKVSSQIDNIEKDNELFETPVYICVSNDEDTIYVSDYDYEAGRVISMCRNGDVKAIYADTNLQGTQKLCVDHLGNVFVCGFESRNICLISPDCRKMKVILTESDGLVECVYFVSYCRSTDRLYVRMAGYNDIKVYQLSR